MTLGEIIARRRKCAMTTRSEILCAARRRFLEESYENVGLREIAGDVGVDVALVGRYFGSKEDLFREVLHGGEGKFDAEVPAGELPDYLVSLVTQRDDSARREQIEKLQLILRSASSPVASQIVRDAVRNDVLAPFARMLGGDNPTERASLVLAVLLGATVLRTVMAVEPLCDGPPEAIRSGLRRLFAAALEDI